MAINATVHTRRWRSTARRVSSAAVAALLFASPAFAQTGAPNSTRWTHGTTLNVFGGIGADESYTAGAAGAAVGWEVTRTFAIEGAGTWFERGAGASGFAADLTALVNPRSTRRFVPFVKGGVGLYHASFDPSRSPMPAFYRNRMVAPGSVDEHAAFTDPTIVVGGGVTAWVANSVSIRPEVDLKVVMRDSNTHLLATAGVRIAYHFVDRPRESRSR